MSFVWNKFGTLISSRINDRYVTIENDKGQLLQMSVKRYGASATRMHEKASALIGESVTVRTSQNTALWDASDWFSGIKKG